MSHAGLPEHGSHAPASSAPSSSATAAGIHPNFSPADLAAFRAEDKAAGTQIVVLMLGIFAMGLVGYIAVCFWVA